jgi:hypothetical protein
VLEHLLELAKQKENGKAALPTILEKEELLKRFCAEQLSNAFRWSRRRVDQIRVNIATSR